VTLTSPCTGSHGSTHQPLTTYQMSLQSVDPQINFSWTVDGWARFNVPLDTV